MWEKPEKLLCHSVAKSNGTKQLNQLLPLFKMFWCQFNIMVYWIYQLYFQKHPVRAWHFSNKYKNPLPCGSYNLQAQFCQFLLAMDCSWSEVLFHARRAELGPKWLHFIIVMLTFMGPLYFVRRATFTISGPNPALTEVISKTSIDFTGSRIRP